MTKHYHILNGDCLKDQFPSELEGELIILRECLVDGPVHGSSKDTFYKIRAEYLEGAYGPMDESYQDKVVTEIDKITAINTPCEVNLWFEDDLFCQVNFWFVTSLLKDKEDVTVYLVRPSHHTQYGFGGLSEQELIEAFDKRVILSDVTSISRLWDYYQANDLVGLAHQAKQLEDLYTFIAEAVQAHIDRIPSPDNLGRPTETIKQLIKQYGSDDFGIVFKAFCERESIYGYGDLQVKRIFDAVLIRSIMDTPLVNCAWLKDNLDDPDLVIIDASPKSNMAGIDSPHKYRYIPKSRHVDMKVQFSDTSSSLPNTFPSSDQLQEECRKLGINQSSKIVIYDNLGTHISPRIWFMFKAMGHMNVSVLDGGLPEWIAKGHQTVSAIPDHNTLGDFEVEIDPSMIQYHTDIIDNCASKSAVVIDARSSGRFEGTAPEPRKGLRSGHIPHSINIPYTEVLNDGKYKSKSELQAVFQKYDLTDKSLIFSCGSGVTACIIMLAAELIMDNEASVYDGSWTEWASKT